MYLIGMPQRGFSSSKYRYQISSIGPANSQKYRISDTDVEVSEYRILNDEKSMECPALVILNHKLWVFSVADPGCLSRIPDPDPGSDLSCHPGSYIKK
jgi:hypothetical protein